MAQVTLELTEYYHGLSSRMQGKLDDASGRSPPGKTWYEFEGKYRDGDAVYYYVALDRDGVGVSDGFVLIREHKVLDVFGWRCLAADWRNRQFPDFDDWFVRAAVL